MKGRKPGIQTIAKRLASTYTGPPPSPPAWLTGDALAEWERLLAELGAVGHITPADSIILAGYCQLYSRWRECEKCINRDGVTILAGDRVVAHPLLRQSISMLGELRKIASEIGLTPASRARIDAPAQISEEENELAAFLAP